MSTTMSDMGLKLAVRTQVAVTDLVRRTREHLAAEDGQAAAEYLGIILVVAAIIAGILAMGIGGKITHAINTAIDGIGPDGGSSKPEGAKP